MEKHEFRKNALDMIYLTGCAVNGTIPDRSCIDALDLPRLFEVCQKHILTACVAYALESAGVHDTAFTQAKEKAVRKNILLDSERSRILGKLEAGKIWYMPLKGAILKDWYPKLGMRQMSDNDILCDSEKMNEVRDVFVSMGYAVKHFGKGCNDSYYKQPVLSFEMHRSLFGPSDMESYFKDVKIRLVRNDGSRYAYHFKNEDFYLYILAHEYKHYSSCGTGVRSLVDTFIFLRKFSDELDWDYINTELKKLGLTDFEKNNRAVAMKLFDIGEMSKEEQDLLDYYIFSGTYGNTVNRIENRVRNFGDGSKSKYIRYRIFPPMEHYKKWYPWAYKHKILLPVAWVFRIVRGVTSRGKKNLREINHLRSK